MTTLAISSVILVSGLTSVGCAPSVAEGAQRVFSTSQICPYESVTVRARSDLPPHSVLKGSSAPPGYTVDSVGQTYEVTGCQKTLVMVCGNPVIGKHPDPFSADFSRSDDDEVHLSLGTEYFAITRALTTSGDRVSTVVVCQPGGQVVQ